MATQDNTDPIQQILAHLNDTKKTDYGPVGNTLGGVADLYSANQMSDAYGDAANSADQRVQALQQQLQSMPTLASMYGPDSSYAKQMAMQLAAKDAAAGRNSQYGPRMQALQADLANKGSQYAQQQAISANQYNQAATAAQTARTQATLGQQKVYAQALGNMFDLGNKTGTLPALNRMAQPYINQGKQALGEMFGTNNPQPTQQQTDAYSQGGPSTGVYGQPQQEPMMDYGQGMDQPKQDDMGWYQ